jgi:hypothetical protein
MYYKDLGHWNLGVNRDDRLGGTKNQSNHNNRQLARSIGVVSN